MSPKNPNKSISRNAISYFLREVISQSVSNSSPGPSAGMRAHSIRGMATSSAFLKNFSLPKVLEAATWKSSSVFTSFCLKDVAFSFLNGFGLSPFVAANSIVS